MNEPSEYFSVAVTEVSGEAVVVVEGEIDLNAAGTLWKAVESVISAGQCRVVVDVSGTTFMDSSGLNVLLRTYEAMGQLPEALVVRGASDGIRRLTRMAGIDDCFTFAD